MSDFPTIWAALRRPPARELLCRLERVHHAPGGGRSPLLLLHGFPDSPAIFAAYATPAERARPWLRGRSIYAIHLPNRRTNPRWPSARDLWAGRVRREFAALVDAVVAASPTGRVAIIAHDWGATLTWELVRRRPDLPVERMAALSVGSSFRHDLAEHGPRALLWLYSTIFGLPYYLPAARHLTAAGLRLAGYAADDIGQAGRDGYHYWDWPLALLRTPARLLGVGAQPAFTDIRFPVLFMRSRLDRLASTAAFEAAIASRPDCAIQLLTAHSHWFPEQQADQTLAAVRPFFG